MMCSRLVPVFFLCLTGVLYAGQNDANLWPNASFETGVDLDSATPILEGWTAGGSNPTIAVVTGEASVEGAYALAVRDDDPEGYGEWFSELPLAGLVHEGDAVELSWSEMYSVGFGEMRLTVLFFNSEGAVASQNHFVTRGDSDGWTGSAGSSSFTSREESLIVPGGAVRMSVSLVSGGPSETTGFMAIDALCVQRPRQPVLLAGNFWPNATFEAGVDLDEPTAEVEGWNRGGSDTTITQLTSEVSVSPSHALIVRDEVPQGFGEWYADLSLTDHASGGDTLQVQWFEIFNVVGGEMRLTTLFFDEGDQVVGERHFTATGDSEGWGGTLTDSTFTQRNESLLVPDNAVTLRVALVSGGSEATTGLLAIDDLSVARAADPQVLANNFWDNAGFEEGTGLDEPTGNVMGWNRGGSDAGINVVTSTISLSPSHALAVVDESTTDFGEWYADKTLDGLADGGDVLDVQWFEIFDVSADGAMRVTILFFDADGGVIGEHHNETRGQSGGWSGEMATSTFSRKNAQVIVPENAVTMRISLVSGGPVETTGVMIIDDLSVARFSQDTISPGNIWPNPTFELGSQLDDPANASPAGWNRGGSNPAINVVTSENSVSPSHALAVIDDDEQGFGEWFQSVTLDERVKANDELAVKWFEIYQTEGDMRLSFLFFDAGGAILDQQHFLVSGESEGWQGDLASSEFTEREAFLLVPEGSVRIQAGLVSGGSEAVTGMFVIDDLSVTPPTGGALQTTAFLFDAATNELTISWQSRSNKFYTIEFSTDLSEWPADVATNLPATGEEMSHSFQHPGLPAAFFRVLEE